MAIGWFTVLKSVPWATVIGNAPAVADGAKKLWKAVAKRPASAQPPAASAQPAYPSDTQAMAALQAKLAALEVAASELHDQLLASSELIKALADQNTQLIERVEANRIRILWLARVMAVLLMVAAGYLVLTLMR